jgi:hypothetical protein
MQGCVPDASNRFGLEGVAWSSIRSETKTMLASRVLMLVAAGLTVIMIINVIILRNVRRLTAGSRKDKGAQ